MLRSADGLDSPHYLAILRDGLYAAGILRWASRMLLLSGSRCVRFWLLQYAKQYCGHAHRILKQFMLKLWGLQRDLYSSSEWCPWLPIQLEPRNVM